MPEYLTPGVYIEEVNTGPRPIEGVGTACAAFVGLALPRFLLRQPYGKESDPIDTFPFEELESDLRHESFLWGNASILCGHVLSGAFQAEGWEMKAAGYGEVGELPVYTFEEDGETKAKPCGEAWLNERAGAAMIGKGLMPVLSVRGRDAVRVGPLQSLARLASPASWQKPSGCAP